MIKIVALTGAGISKASGIPTFEEMGDLRSYLERSYFNKNPKKFYEILKQLKESITKAQPNDAHLALAHYQVPIITMNIDSLHQRGGSKEVIEIHGNLQTVYCGNCKKVFKFEVIYNSINCNCRSILQPNVVLYGDNIPKLFEAIDIVKGADLLLVVGTSFYTSTAHQLVHWGRVSGAKIEIINKEAEILVEEFLKRHVKV